MEENFELKGFRQNERIIRLSILFLIMIVAIIASSTQKQWITLDSSQTITKIWFATSLIITLFFSVWINFKLTQSKRYAKEYLTDCRAWLLMFFALILLYTAIIFVLIVTDVLNNVGWLSLLGGPFLVTILLLFDYKILKMEKEILAEEKDDFDVNKKEFDSARAAVYHLDWPIFCGVLLSSIFCVLLLSINHEYPDFVHGFAAGATGMQIIIGNIAFEFIH